MIYSKSKSDLPNEKNINSQLDHQKCKNVDKSDAADDDKTTGSTAKSASEEPSNLLSVHDDTTEVSETGKSVSEHGRSASDSLDRSTAVSAASSSADRTDSLYAEEQEDGVVRPHGKTMMNPAAGTTATPISTASSRYNTVY